MAFNAMRDFAPGQFHYSHVSCFFSGEKKYRGYIAAGLVVVVGAFKIVSYLKKKERRKRWNQVEKDTVVLHMFDRGRYSPNLSPFVIKLETYLRMVDIPYVVDHEEPMGSKQKSPWITLNGEEIADSELIMEKLGSKYQKNCSGHLSPQDKAVAAAMRIMVEDNFLWCLATWRYIIDNCKGFMATMEVPFVMKILVGLFKKKVKQMTYSQGMGRHTFAEIEEFGRKDLMYLSDWLGDKHFFMGDKPTEVDCAIFGMLVQIEWNSPGSPYLRMIKNEYKNLSSYCLRMKEKFWPDWNQCLKPPRSD